ncbi:hypothetical protein GGR52DRAFT_546108 [Hypoxylon sp. FL1284]|nr:hypothetical protein GGR52DRAFT_546108 [Hypoxylon sp. FL1284]
MLLQASIPSPGFRLLFASILSSSSVTAEMPLPEQESIFLDVAFGVPFSGMPVEGTELEFSRLFLLHTLLHPGINIAQYHVCTIHPPPTQASEASKRGRKERSEGTKGRKGARRLSLSRFANMQARCLGNAYLRCRKEVRGNESPGTALGHSMR